MAEIIEIPQEEKKSPVDVLNQLLIPDNAEESTEFFATLISLPDEEFIKVAPVLADSYNRSLNDTNSLMIISQAMNLSGAKLEDMQEMIEELNKQIDGFDEEELSKPKKDFLKSMANSLFTAFSSVEGIAKRFVKIPIELCHEDAHIPQYAHPTDAGADIYAIEDVNIAPGETKIVPLGFKLSLPQGYAVLIHPRSGLSSKTKMRIANSIGLCDSDYKDEYGVILENIEPRIKDLDVEFDEETQEYKIKSILYGSTVHITKGERIGQLRLVEVPKMMFYEVDDIKLMGEDRGGGFGSTDQN